jgi:hypothetical protein
MDEADETCIEVPLMSSARVSEIVPRQNPRDKAEIF